MVGLLLRLGIVAAAALALAACSGDESAETETRTGPIVGIVTVTMRNGSCELDGPSTVSDGHLTVEFVNESAARASIELLRLADGMTFDALDEHVAREDERLELGRQTVGYGALATLEVSTELAGDRRQVVHEPLPEDLEPGEHAFLCISESELDVAGPLTLVP